MEAAYSDAKRRRQVLIPFVKDDEPVDARKGAVTKPVEYLKLHGCLKPGPVTRFCLELPLQHQHLDRYGLLRCVKWPGQAQLRKTVGPEPGSSYRRGGYSRR
ncbi:MAG: hypothetical protein QOF70_4830 [Acetobacteraceae bacterium]|nr:hypothetical protein [Acetobacteraceae bacterium]